MRTCATKDEVVQAVRTGRWPNGVTSEMRDHVAACPQCADEARVMTAFAAARNSAMHTAPQQSAGLLWWKAQLRRRHEAMERLEQPGRAIPTITISASVILLLGVLFAVWKRLGWPHLAAMVKPGSSNTWTVAVVAAVLCGIAVASVLLGSSEDRN